MRFISQKTYSEGEKIRNFRQGSTFDVLHVASNPNVNENDISLINKGAKNNKLSLIFSVGLYIYEVFCGLVKSKRKKKKIRIVGVD